MDSVRGAFIRWVALEKWREVEDLRAAAGVDLATAIAEAGDFPGRGRYRSLWSARWKVLVTPAAGADSGVLFASIEQAVKSALADEENERKSAGDRPIEEDPEYKAFVDSALERLLGEGDLGVKW